MSENRKIAAILVADVVGYSRLAEADEEGTLARLRALRRELIDPAIATHHGRIVKRTGDGSLIEFRSVVDAVACQPVKSDWVKQAGESDGPDRSIVGPTTPFANGRCLRTAAVPWAVLATCHIKPTLTLARGSEVKQEFRRKKSSRRR